MDICLVAVPDMPLSRPSIALSILKSSLINAGFETGVLYANLEFAEQIGIENYWFISTYADFLDQVCEWLFSQKAFPDFHSDDNTYFTLVEPMLRELVHDDNLLNFYLNGQSIQSYFTNLRSNAAAFIDKIAADIVAAAPRIVGCSSTFRQHCASLALLRRIHELNPDIITMMGGANCEGVMGQTTHKNFTFVDYVVSGEAELLLPELCRNILKQGRNIPEYLLPSGVLAPLSRSSAPVRNIGRAVVQDLSQSPIPDFTDFFAQLDKYGFKDCIHTALMIETSRGCWWGDKHQCTFCGLNGGDANFRSKTAQRVQQELAALSEKYNIRNYLTADNILEHRYFKDLIPALGQTEPKYAFLFEVKSNLSRQQVRQLKEAGIHSIQAGIESLHTELLKLLDKGVTARQNIELLKWALEYQIDIFWFILSGIPEAQEKWYAEIVELLPLLTHFQPPINISKLYYTRFSPYHNNQNHYGLKLAPAPSYQYIYPIPPDDLADIAYFFVDLNKTDYNLLHSKTTHNLKSIYETWLAAWTADNRPKLSMTITDEAISITDTRPCAIQQEITLIGLARDIYLICDTATLLPRIIDELSKGSHAHIPPLQIALELDTLVKLKIMAMIEGRYLGLAVREHNDLTYTAYPAGNIDKAKIHLKFLLNNLTHKTT
ncbi:MAG: RiPP maturation radical SAM protein 1 [Methylococcaceae bacterium]|nr:MAG: RiPP maturation radical SAM protein 1 [Methylococcaceae bacterium]